MTGLAPVLTPLNHGKCLFENHRDRKRLQPNITMKRRLVSGPMIVSNGNDRFLCCVSASFPQDGDQFTWSESIRIASFGKDAIHLLNSSVDFLCALSANNTFVSRNSATVSLRNNNNNNNSSSKDTLSFLSTFQLSSSLLISATIVYKAKFQLSTLQQACLKRQLAGFPIVFREDEISTEINIHFQGQSISLHVSTLTSKAKGTISFPGFSFVKYSTDNV